MADRLYRSRDDRMLAGVAGGLARVMDADPSIIRVVWVVVTVLSGGLGLLVYVVMAIVVPEAPDGWDAARTAARPRRRPANRSRQVAGSDPMAGWSRMRASRPPRRHRAPRGLPARRRRRCPRGTGRARRPGHPVTAGPSP